MYGHAGAPIRHKDVVAGDVSWSSDDHVAGKTNLKCHLHLGLMVTPAMGHYGSGKVIKVGAFHVGRKKNTKSGKPRKNSLRECFSWLTLSRMRQQVVA